MRGMIGPIDPQALRSADASRLAALLQSGIPHEAPVEDRSRASFFTSLIDSSFADDVETAGLLSAPLARSLAAACAPPAATYREALTDANTPPALLRAIKGLGKLMRRGSFEGVAPEIGTALYFSAALAGLAFHRINLTALDEARLRRGLAWLRERPWLDREFRGWVEAASAELSE